MWVGILQSNLRPYEQKWKFPGEEGIASKLWYNNSEFLACSTDFRLRIVCSLWACPTDFELASFLHYVSQFLYINHFCLSGKTEINKRLYLGWQCNKKRKSLQQQSTRVHRRESSELNGMSIFCLRLHLWSKWSASWEMCFIFDLLKIHFMLKPYLLNLTLFTVVVEIRRYRSILTDGVTQRMAWDLILLWISNKYWHRPGKMESLPKSNNFFKLNNQASLGLSCGIWDLVPWPGIKPGPLALGMHSLSHWTTREVS